MQASIRNRLITEPFELFFEMKHTALEIYTLCAAANAGCWLEFLSSGLFPVTAQDASQCFELSIERRDLRVFVVGA